MDDEDLRLIEEYELNELRKAEEEAQRERAEYEAALEAQHRWASERWGKP